MHPQPAPPHHTYNTLTLHPPHTHLHTTITTTTTTKVLLLVFSHSQLRFSGSYRSIASSMFPAETHRHFPQFYSAGLYWGLFCGTIANCVLMALSRMPCAVGGSLLPAIIVIKNYAESQIGPEVCLRAQHSPIPILILPRTPTPTPATVCRPMLDSSLPWS